MKSHDIASSEVWMGLHGMAGKDAVRHQSEPTSCYNERCCEALPDVILLQRCQTRMPIPRSHVKRIRQV